MNENTKIETITISFEFEDFKRFLKQLDFKGLDGELVGEFRIAKIKHTDNVIIGWYDVDVDDFETSDEKGALHGQLTGKGTDNDDNHE